MSPLSPRIVALLCLVLGAIAACGFAPLDLWPLTLAGLVGWIALVHASPTIRSALWRGWLFGVGHFTVNNNWIQHAFDFQDAMPPVLGYGAVVALALYLAVYPMLAAGLAWRIAGGRPGPDAGFVLVFAAAWITTEWLRATMFTGYAWDPIGVAWLPLIGVARLAAYVGTYAMSGLMVAAAGSLVLAAHRQWRCAAGLAVALAIAAVVGGIGVRAPQSSAQIIRVVQPNIGQDQRGPDGDKALLARLSALSGRPGPAPRLIVWPEGVVEDYLEDGYPYDAYRVLPAVMRHRLAALLGPGDVLLTGGTALKFDTAGNVTMATNSVFAVGADAGLRGRYDKAHLVPYGEYLPMRPLLEPIGLSRLVPGSLDYDPGPGPMTLAIPGFGRIGFQICYEIIFSGEVVDAAHRPRLIFNPSNEAWFGTWGPPQFLAQGRMRAIEEGLPIVRSTPTGISAVIAADGRLVATIPSGKAGAIEMPIPDALPPTLFACIGNWMTVLAVAILLAAAVAIRRRAR